MKHLKIEQNTGSIEVVDPKVIDKLYNLILFHPVGETLDSTSNLKGNLQCSHAYEDVVSYLTTNYPDLQISVTGGIYIRFNDPTVEQICATNWGDGTGITTVQMAIANTDFCNEFQNNTIITSFDEIKDFALVTRIGGWAFSGCTNLISVDLSNIVTLGVQCFQACVNLKSVKLSSKFNSVDSWYGCFRGCSKLTDVGDISGLTIIYNDLFSGCTSLTSVNISNKCISINDNAFGNCTNLITLGDLSNVTNMGNSAFYSCTSLQSMTGLGKVTQINGECFSGCINLQTLDLSNCTSLGSNTFYNCNKLTSIGNASTINDLSGSGTFDQCLLLANNDFKPNIIGGRVFRGCTSLSQIDLSNCTSIGFSAFENCTNLISVDLSNIVTLGNSAFYNCNKLTSIGNVNKLTTINQETFYGTSLTSFIIPKSIASIGNKAFGNCSNLVSINFETGGTTQLYLGAQLFSNCPLLTKIVLPSNTTNLETDFLGYHDVASTIVLNPTTVPTLNGAIGGSTDTQFYVPDSSLNTYKAAAEWSDMASRIHGMSTYPIGTEIPSKAFQNWTGLANMDLTNVTLINDHAFAGSGLANNYTVGPMQICSSTVESTIKEWAFQGAKKIESITLPYVSSIGTGAFSDCTSLVTVGSSPALTSIADAAFSGCTALQRVILGSHIVSIGNLCFQNCTALDFIHIDSTACPALSSSAFDGAKSTFKIYVPDAQVSTYKAASVWSTFADKIYSFTQQDTDFPGTR